MRHESLRFTLLDQQIVDSDELPVGRVDDVTLAVGPSGEVRVESLETGPEVLGKRMNGLVGAWLQSAASRLRPPEAHGAAGRIDRDLVAELSTEIGLRVPLRDLPGIASVERRLGRWVARIPGGGDASE